MPSQRWLKNNIKRNWCEKITFNSTRTMKRLLYIVFFICCLSVTGQAQAIRNSNNSAIATIESDGTVRNGNNSYHGKIERDGTIRGSNNAYLGKIESDGTVRGSNNSYLGKVESDGTVRGSNNAYLGKVESDGTVRDSSNRTLGYAKGVAMRHAALFFFFSFFK